MQTKGTPNAFEPGRCLARVVTAAWLKQLARTDAEFETPFVLLLATVGDKTAKPYFGRSIQHLCEMLALADPLYLDVMAADGEDSAALLALLPTPRPRSAEEMGLAVHMAAQVEMERAMGKMMEKPNGQ